MLFLVLFAIFRFGVAFSRDMPTVTTLVANDFLVPIGIGVLTTIGPAGLFSVVPRALVAVRSTFGCPLTIIVSLSAGVSVSTSVAFTARESVAAVEAVSAIVAVTAVIAISAGESLSASETVTIDVTFFAGVTFAS